MVVGGREPEQLSSLSRHWECSPLQGNSFYAALIIALCPPPPSMQETPCQQQEWGLAAGHLPRGVGQPQLRAQVGNGVKAPCWCAPKIPALSMGQHRPCDLPRAQQEPTKRLRAELWHGAGHGLLKIEELAPMHLPHRPPGKHRMENSCILKSWLYTHLDAGCIFMTVTAEKEAEIASLSSIAQG